MFVIEKLVLMIGLNKRFVKSKPKVQFWQIVCGLSKSHLVDIYWERLGKMRFGTMQTLRIWFQGDILRTHRLLGLSSGWMMQSKPSMHAKYWCTFQSLSLTTVVASIETSQAGSMTAEGIPNDLFNNFNPLTIIVLLPILNDIVPLLRKYRILFPPVYRITLGFVVAPSSQLAGYISTSSLFHFPISFTD